MNSHEYPCLRAFGLGRIDQRKDLNIYHIFMLSTKTKTPSDPHKTWLQLKSQNVY